MIKEIDVFDNISSYKKNFYMMSYGAYLLNIEKNNNTTRGKKNEKDKQNFKPCYGNDSYIFVSGIHFC